MKKTYFLFYGLIVYFALFTTACQTAKNIVPNASFEAYNECPTNYSQGNKIKDWTVYQAVPDFFHTCARNTNADVPNNFYGNRKPAEGNGYLGLTIWHENAPSDVIGTKLTTPLKKGKTYLVSFKAVIGEKYARYYANNIGIWFTNNPQNDFNVGKAHILQKDILKAEKDWVEISGIFEADEDYTHLLLGNFFIREATNTEKRPDEKIASNGGFEAAYYFFDDLKVLKTKKKK